MIITVELSMYPFQESYRDLIKDFLKKLHSYQGLHVTTGPTSTVIVGEYPQVMACLTELLPWSHETHGQSVFVAKFIPEYNPE